MRQIAFKTMLFVMSAVLVFSGCKKEGCTDPDSINYDPTATVDDHSCQYEGSAVFWYGKATADSLRAYGISSVVIYVDGQTIGSYATSVYFTTEPDCETPSVVKVKKDLGDVKSKAYSYKVVDGEYGFELWSGTVNIDANTCLAVELTWNKKKKILIKH